MDSQPSRHVTLIADPSSIGTIRHTIAAFAAEVGAGDVTVNGVALSVSEAVTNAVRHAYDGRPIGEVRARAWVASEAGHRVLRVSIADDGWGMRPRTDSPGLGLGLPLIAHASTSMDVAREGPGATIRMSFELP